MQKHSVIDCRYVADCKWCSNLRSQYTWTTVWLVWIAAGDRLMLHDHYVIQPGLSVLQVLSNIGINPTSLSYFLLSPDLYTILPRFELILRFPKQHSVLWVPYWPQTFIWVDWLWKPFVCCLRSVHVITHARFCRLHKEELNPAVFTFRVRRNTSWVALDKYRKDSLNQKNIL